jgi:hypothetical protein
MVDPLAFDQQLKMLSYFYVVVFLSDLSTEVSLDE